MQEIKTTSQTDFTIFSPFGSKMGNENDKMKEKGIEIKRAKRQNWESKWVSTRWITYWVDNKVVGSVILLKLEAYESTLQFFQFKRKY